MIEKNILAYFKSPEHADSVFKKLQSLRIVDMSIDRFGAYSMHHSLMSNQTVPISSVSTTSLSEWSNGGYDDTKGYDVLLTVVLEQSSFEPAVRIIEEAGGMI